MCSNLPFQCFQMIFFISHLMFPELCFDRFRVATNRLVLVQFALGILQPIKHLLVLVGKLEINKSRYY